MERGHMLCGRGESKAVEGVVDDPVLSVWPDLFGFCGPWSFGPLFVVAF
jgi:hypothetical protein